MGEVFIGKARNISSASVWFFYLSEPELDSHLRDCIKDMVDHFGINNPGKAVIISLDTHYFDQAEPFFAYSHFEIKKLSGCYKINESGLPVWWITRLRETLIEMIKQLYGFQGRD